LRYFNETLPRPEHSALYDEAGTALAELAANERREGRVLIVVDDRISRAGIALMEGAVLIDPDAPLESPDFVFPGKTTDYAAVLAPPSRTFWRTSMRGLAANDRAIDMRTSIDGEGDTLVGRYIVPPPLGRGVPP
jgi:hypothetical protein